MNKSLDLGRETENKRGRETEKRIGEGDRELKREKEIEDQKNEMKRNCC